MIESNTQIAFIVDRPMELTILSQRRGLACQKQEA